MKTHWMPAAALVVLSALPLPRVEAGEGNALSQLSPLNEHVVVSHDSAVASDTRQQFPNRLRRAAAPSGIVRLNNVVVESAVRVAAALIAPSVERAATPARETRIAPSPTSAEQSTLFASYKTIGLESAPPACASGTPHCASPPKPAPANGVAPPAPIDAASAKPNDSQSSSSLLDSLPLRDLTVPDSDANEPSATPSDDEEGVQ
jgi:hypothetical protein